MSPFQGCRITEQIRVKSPKTEDIKNFKVTISIGFCAFDLGTTLTENPLSEYTERGFSVVPPGIEPGTQGFSVLCSTN